jgi:GDP-L-fucose synthase
MKILITGANGYIGKSLCNALKNKHEVFTITRENCNLVDQDNVNLYFKDKWFDIVIHCAVIGGNRLKPETSEVIDSNLMMYYNLLSNKNHFKKLIHFGSGAEFHRWWTPYGLSKKVISQSINAQDNFHNLIIYGLFDEFELDRRFIKSNIKRYINKESMQINDNNKMDFFYMQDLIKVVNYCIENENAPKNINCVYPENLTLKDIADIINTLDDYKVEIKINGSELPLEGYVSFNKDLGLEYIGLKKGIINTYNKLKCNQ